MSDHGTIPATVDSWLAFMMIKYDEDDEAYALITMVNEVRKLSSNLPLLDSIFLDILKHDVWNVD